MTQKAYTYRKHYAEQQDRSAESKRAAAGAHTLFRLYTERRPNLLGIVAGHFQAANLLETSGLYDGQLEQGAIIEIVAALGARRSVLQLAHDIAVRNAQNTVLVTWNGPAGYESVNVSQ